jgi:hypothetical protein
VRDAVEDAFFDDEPIVRDRVGARAAEPGREVALFFKLLRRERQLG